MPTDVLHLGALGLQLLPHDVGIPWALNVKGMVGHAWPGTVLAVEKAQARAPKPAPHHVGTCHLVMPGLLCAQHVSLEANRRLEVFGIDVPVLTYNVARSFQLDTGAAPRRRSGKRTYAYVLRSMRTLRFTLVAGAGRLARIGGRQVLRPTFNPATAALYTRLEQRLAA